MIQENLPEKNYRICPACRNTTISKVGVLNGYPLIKCRECGLIYAGLVPNEDDLKKIYNQIYQSLPLYKSKLNRLKINMIKGPSAQGYYRNKIFLNRIIPNTSDKLLEIGCGAGDFLIAAKKKGWSVEGIDLSEEIIEASTKIHGLSTRQGALDSFDFEEDSFKAIVCWEVLEHLVEPRLFIRRIRELLRPDGIFACSVPNTSHKVPCFRDGPLGPASVPPVHLNFWDRKSFHNFFTINDYKPLYLSPNYTLIGQIGWRKHLIRFFINQLAAIIGLREGGTIYALLDPQK